MRPIPKKCHTKKVPEQPLCVLRFLYLARITFANFDYLAVLIDHNAEGTRLYSPGVRLADIVRRIFARDQSNGLKLINVRHVNLPQKTVMSVGVPATAAHTLKCEVVVLVSRYERPTSAVTEHAGGDEA